jgi:SAM-dependent methyltransferase
MAEQPVHGLADGDVIRTIAPEDEMYAASVDVYLQKGRLALSCIQAAIGALPETYPRQPIRRALDLPCGHGRVLRHLRAAFPQAEIVACDIDRGGVDFCAHTFDAVPAYSAEDPAQIELEGPFDLIWCGSLLTHVDSHHWTGFLDLFHRLVGEGGVVVFTTHGRRAADLLWRGDHLGLAPESAARLLSVYERSGFGFESYPRQDGYGISLSSPAWVTAAVTSRPGWRLLGYTEMGWGSFQDVISCVGRDIEDVMVNEDMSERGYLWQFPRRRHQARRPEGVRRSLQRS